MTDEICCGSSFGTFEEQDKVLEIGRASCRERV